MTIFIISKWRDISFNDKLSIGKRRIKFNFQNHENVNVTLYDILVNISNLFLRELIFIWGKVFKSGLNKFYGRGPLKNLLSPLLNTLSICSIKTLLTFFRRAFFKTAKASISQSSFFLNCVDLLL